MTDITIPREALEAAAESVYISYYGYSYGEWSEAPQWVRDLCFMKARAACLAMINAWPQMSTHDRCKWSVMPDVPLIILPLQENPNDKG